MRRRIGVPIAFAVAVAITLASTGLAVATRAQAPPTGREVALGLETACDDRSDTLYAIAGDRRTVVGRWVTVTGPTFGVAPGGPRHSLTAHAVDPRDPRRLLVSDGSSIQLSEDGGCTWGERHFDTPPIETDEIGGEVAVADRIHQIEFGGGARDRRAYALVAPTDSEVGEVRVLVSDNGGLDWEDRSQGLPPAYTRYDTAQFGRCPGGPCTTAVLAASPSDPDTAYVGVGRSFGLSIFVTRDGGRTWSGQQGASAVFGGEVTELVVAPRDPAEVWGVFTGKLARTRDAGASWEAAGVDGAAGLHLSSDADSTQVQALSASAWGEPFTHLARSVDGGSTFDRIPLAGPLRGTPWVAQGGSPDDLVLATERPSQALRFDPTTRSLSDIRAAGLEDVTGPRRDASNEPVFWFRQFAGLAVFVPGPLPPGDFPPMAKLPFDPAAAAAAEPGRVPGELHPAMLERDIGPEGSWTVDYRLELPALPTPVDIWFLMDTSGSMGGAIEGLRDGIQEVIRRLAESGIDAWFGLATFPAQNVIYDRQADIAPPNADFYAALGRLATDGATAEVHPTALYQSVTGAGQADAGIPPGRGASFRPQALKIIVHATDEAYGSDPKGPTQEQAAEAMAAAGVRHVGLDLAAGAADPSGGADAGGLRSTKRDHDAMAIATGTLAPKEGIDCNGDGTNELEEGEPVTCPIERRRDSLEIAPAIISAVRAVRDETAVALTVAAPGGISVEIEEPVRAPVNLKTPNSLPFSVRYTCPPEMTGQVGEVSLRATVRGIPSAGAVARVGCGLPVAAPAAPPVREPRTPSALVPMIIAPPQLVPDLEPGLSPLNQTAPAQVGQPSAQAGMAAQPGEVATAKQRSGRDGPAPPTATAADFDDRDPAPAAVGTIAAGATLALALGGWAVRRERGPVVARA